MGTALIKLNIVFPEKVTPVIVDALDAIEPALSGYTIVNARGHGSSIHLQSSAERVAGSMRSTLAILILPEKDKDTVLHTVKEACPKPVISYWVEPVLEYGSLQSM